MKSSKLIMGCLALLGLTAGMAHAQEDVDREAIAERLAPVGEVCLQGEDCGTAMAASGGGDSAASGGADGETIYNNVCMACHDTGAAGAPKRGDEAAWAGRTDKGFETLLGHAINGFNAMPARGGNPNLSDEEVQAAVAYLVEPVMEVPAQAAGGDDAAPADDGADASAEPATAGIDGAAIYNSVCMACHDTGAAGAPKKGDAAAWAARLEQGTETLYDHAINGFNAMPAKGGNPGLSDAEVKAAVDHLLGSVE
ncbi:c-type cytochrome [Halomonas koreensis]|uniref:C-type cytochrome n=1 Tax=Halomonas koreensis TaxID=245385 RepID=A0ABU1G179_9GAMM|nr:c-type cytochrome [Halomonas koreensis]MDR5866476.1 c-type cytochrome [Halomonas koreensis]